MIKRAIIGDVCRLLKQFPVVAIIGPRQVGKTTLAKQVKVKLGLTPKLKKGFYNAKEDLGNPPSWIIYSGTERYPLSGGTEAIGLDQFCSSVIPQIIK